MQVRDRIILFLRILELFYCYSVAPKFLNGEPRNCDGRITRSTVRQFHCERSACYAPRYTMPKLHIISIHVVKLKALGPIATTGN